MPLPFRYHTTARPFLRGAVLGVLFFVLDGINNANVLRARTASGFMSGIPAPSQRLPSGSSWPIGWSGCSSQTQRITLPG
jgi:hypothetical protein